MTKKSVAGSVKNILLWGVLGLAAAFLFSLCGTAVAMKTADPLNSVGTLSMLSVGLGAFAAAFGGRKTEGGIAAGFGTGGVYILLLLIASLWGERGESSPYLLLVAAAVGTAAGALLSKGKKSTARKRIKRLTSGKI